MIGLGTSKSAPRGPVRRPRRWSAASVWFVVAALTSGPAPLAEEPLTLVPLGSEWSHGPDDASAAFSKTEGRQALQLRRTFELSEQQLAQIRGLRLRLTRGDGVVVQLNGTQVYRLGSPYDETDASPTHGVQAPQGYYYRWYFGPEQLITGTNVVEVEAYHDSSRAGDPDFDLELVAPIGEAVIWRGPYLQKGTPHSATLRFATSAPAKPVLRYGKLLEKLDRSQSGPLEVDHTLVLEGLESDTTYYYAVEAAGRWLLGPKADQHFRTHPLAGTERPVRIWVLGDSGRGQFSGSEVVRDAYSAYSGERGTDVWLMLGDNAYDAGRIEEYQDALFDVYPSVLRNTFLWPSIGNHDRRAFSTPTSAPYLDLFDLPAQGESGGVASKVEHFYSFDYGNVHFVVLDSEVASLDSGSPQIEWLKRDLEKNQAEWTIGIAHIPPYSKGNHDSDQQRRHFIVRGDAVPILEANGVDLLLSGHSHAYERSHLIRGHYGPSSSWRAATHLVDRGNGCPADALAAQCSGGADGAYDDAGTVYAVVGCSSYFSARGKLKHPAMARVVRSLGSMVIDVEGNRLEARFLQGDGKIGDRFVIRHPPAKLDGKSVAGSEGAAGL